MPILTEQLPESAGRIQKILQIEHPVHTEENQLHASFRCGTTGPAAQPFQCFAKMELNPNKVENL